MKNKLLLLMLTALVGNVQAVDSGQNAPLNHFEHQLVTAWWKNPDLVQDIQRIKEFHKVNKGKDQVKIVNLPLQTVTGFVDPALGTVAPGILQQSLKQIDFAFEQHDVTTVLGDCQLPVAFMKKGDTVVAAYINDTRPTGNIDLQNWQVSTLIKNLHNQHGTNLPILVNTPNREPSFSHVTGTLYSSAQKINVVDSHDLAVHGGTGGTVKVTDHKGNLRTNADRVTIWRPINLNLTCDNKKATIDVKAAFGRPSGDSGTATINGHQGIVSALGPGTTVKMKDHSGNVTIGSDAKAIIENATMGALNLDHTGIALIVNGSLKDLNVKKGMGFLKGGMAFLVDSTVNNLRPQDAKSDVYHITTGGDLSKAPGMLEEILKDKDGSNEDKQKTMNSFNALWSARCRTKTSQKSTKNNRLSSCHGSCGVGHPCGLVSGCGVQ